MKRKTMQWIALLSAASFSVAAAAGGKGGGSAAGGAHMSESGKANTNGRYAEERKFGQDRAAARRSEQGAAHQKGSVSSGDAQGPKTGAAGPAAAEAPAVTPVPSK